METVTDFPEPTAADDRVVGPLRDVRRPLHEGLSVLQTAAEAAASAEPALAFKALDRALAFLQRTFLPSCEAEEFTLFIAVDGVYGATGAVAVMRAQHQVMAEMTTDLEKVMAAARQANDPAAYAKFLHPLLYGLYGLARGHLESEDAAYLTILDEHLSESQVGVIVDNLDRIASARRSPAR
jgi:hemerythrin-like domain-containing protein